MDKKKKRRRRDQEARTDVSERQGNDRQRVGAGKVRRSVYGHVND
jgi:hypothetical protein